jgi:hypothetical protein
MLIGGDFNILRSDSDKNKPGGTNKWSSEREMCPWAISKYFGD